MNMYISCCLQKIRALSSTFTLLSLQRKAGVKHQRNTLTPLLGLTIPPQCGMGRWRLCQLKRLQNQPWFRTAASCCKLQRRLQSQLIGDLSLWHHCCMHLGVKEHDMNNVPVWNMFSHTNKDMRGEKQSEAFLSFHWWVRMFCGLTGQHVRVEYNNAYSTCCCLITGPYKSPVYTKQHAAAWLSERHSLNASRAPWLRPRFNRATIHHLWSDIALIACAHAFHRLIIQLSDYH